MEKQIDLTIFEKFNFEYSPVGVKFLLTKPKGLEPLDEKFAFCEMLKVAQTSKAFFTTKDNHNCGLGPILLGMVEPDPIFESGCVGEKLGVYEDARANRRLYQHMPRLAKNSVNYVAFSALAKLSFDPDLLIVTAKPSQAEVILRAMGYKDGSMWNAKGASIGGCAWLYTYPYVSGEINILITGLHHGMKARHVFPEGLLLLSIPFDIIPSIVNNLKKMQWDLPQYTWGKDVHLQRMKEIGNEIKKELEK